jgi:hypothetical protein
MSYMSSTCGLCPRHYHRWRKYGDPFWAEYTTDRRLSVSDRLEAKSMVTADGCRLWQGTTLSTGYGQISVGGKGRMTHVVAFEQWVGPVPDGFQVNHLCRNRNCIEPTHLYAGTQRQNLADRHRDGTAPLGRPIPSRRRFTEAQVSAIREDPRSQSTIAAEYGVAQSTISKIRRGVLYPSTR